MRYLMEILVFLALAVLAGGIIFILTLVAGSPFHIQVSQAAAFGVLAVLFWFPAFANIHIAVTGTSPRNRFLAATRALGLLLASAAVATAFCTNAGITVTASLFIAGMCLNFGTLWLEK